MVNLQATMKSKALFLLFIFLLNTAVGLNCALRACSDGCKDEIAEHHHHPVTSMEKNEPCCQGAVNSFASLAKLVPQSVKVFIPIPITYIRSYDQSVLKPVLEVKPGHQLLIDKRQRPPTQNIRIAIQSFQI